MLTFPSHSLSQIVCPMDEDDIPPNPVCSAPPLSELPSLLLPLSSITPSSTNDGQSEQRRSGGIQENRMQTSKKQVYPDDQTATIPSTQNLSPTRRRMESTIMVQVSQSSLPGVERTRVQEKQNQDEFEISSIAERQNEDKDPQSAEFKMDVCPAENVVKPFEEKMNLDTTKPDMDTVNEVPNGDITESASASKGWVIGPLFQSLKSKMASFTEIVMTPVKLFGVSSPLPSLDHLDKFDDLELHTNGEVDSESSESGDIFPPGQTENESRDDKTNHQNLSDGGETQSLKTVAPSYSKKLQFDEFSSDASEQTAECAINGMGKVVPDAVPLLQGSLASVASKSFESSVLLQSPDKASASQESKLKTSSAVEELSLPRLVIRRGPDLKKVHAEDKNHQSNSEITDRQLNWVKSTNIDSIYMNNTLPQFSSVCYPQPEVEQLQLGGDNMAADVESSLLVRQSIQNNLSDGTNRTSLTPSLDTQQMECKLNSDVSSASNDVRSKRGPRDSTKRKRMTGVSQTADTKNQQHFNSVSHSDVIKERRTSRRGVGLMNAVTDEEETIQPNNKRGVMLTRANRKGQSVEMFATINEAAIIPQTEASSDALLVCSQVKGSEVKSSGYKRPRTRKTLSNPDLNEKGMDLETTGPVTSAEQAKEKLLSVVLVRADIKQCRCTGRCSATNKKHLKRKLTQHTSSVTEKKGSLASSSSAESMTTEFSPSQSVPRVDSLTTGRSQPPKRSKNSLKGAVKSSAFSQTQKKNQCSHRSSVTKENQSQNNKAIISTDPGCFEMTPLESNTELNLPCDVQLNKEDKHVTEGTEMSATSTADKIFLTDSEVGSCSLRPSIRHANSKRRSLRRRSRVLVSRVHKNDEGLKSVTLEDADLAASYVCLSETSCSRRLLRSYSCPEILSLHPHDLPWTTSLHPPHHSRTHPSHHHTHLVSHSHRSPRRTRRHTVCSVEVEREIAPLCLRKEVYPSRRSALYDPVNPHLSPSRTHSPSFSLSALASCFLSSPLAFLSKKSDWRGAAGSLTTSAHAPPPSSSSVTSPSSSSTWHPPAFISRSDSTAVSDTSSSGNPLRHEAERRQQREEEDYGEDTSSSSQESEDVGLREERALSDSEIKAVKKHEERGKVSSIKIRKTLPKPQTNLTPMGLPRPIRLKKKEFSLEEIYTNKNFSKPPESRLETIYEVPHNRKNGSESWFGPRRVKRFLEFLEVGEVRKPKKPLVGVGKAGVSSSRKRRGVFPKAEPSLGVQDVDSLLCAKLDELNLWLIHDQKDI